MSWSALQLVFELSWRSLWNHRVKSIVVGTIILFGVFLLVVADALLESINNAMESSITSSITGHLQVYDKNAEDKLSLMGIIGNRGAKPSLGKIANFAAVRDILASHPNVSAVVPMGTDSTIVYQGNRVDKTLASLRLALKQGDDSEQRNQIEKLLMLVGKLEEQYRLTIDVSNNQEKFHAAIEDLQTVQGVSFWRSFDEDQESALQFLDTRIAPLVSEANPIFLEFLATDIVRFKEAFYRFKLVEGQMLPDGARGIMINHTQYEEYLKDRIARMFDVIYVALNTENRAIKTDLELQYYIRRRAKEYQLWLLSLDAQSSEKMKTELVDLLNTSPQMANNNNLEFFIQQFLNLTDENFDRHYRFFYDRIAPMIQLYQINIGDLIPLQNLGPGSSLKAKFYGTFQFEGVEDSGFSGIYNLIDLMSFRDLYGFMTEEKKWEMLQLKKEFSTVEFDRTAVEDALFGDTSWSSLNDVNGDDFSDEHQDNEFELEQGVLVNTQDRLQTLIEARYTRDQLDRGPVLSAAIVLKNPKLLQQTENEINQLIIDKKLPLQVIDWQTAAGFVGQMIQVMQIVLFTFIVFVFCISMVVVNNAMLLATMQRYTEIGTLRAIGAGRGIILGMFFIESLMLTIIAGGIGGLLGFLLVQYLGTIGIPAPTYEFKFLFGGELLFPQIDRDNIYMGPIVIIAVSVVATLYPALLATRVPPVVALTAQE
ncbi:MAG: FtsX-like permease family protein [Pseudomonadales bacterium]|nr:FtsX-like permease family protein [Pseudomonadales bacterium]